MVKPNHRLQMPNILNSERNRCNLNMVGERSTCYANVLDWHFKFTLLSRQLYQICQMVISVRSTEGQWSLRNHYRGWRQFCSWTSQEFRSLARKNSKWNLCLKNHHVQAYFSWVEGGHVFPSPDHKEIINTKKMLMDLKIQWGKKNLVQKKKTAVCEFLILLAPVPNFSITRRF